MTDFVELLMIGVSRCARGKLLDFTRLRVEPHDGT